MERQKRAIRDAPIARELGTVVSLQAQQGNWTTETVTTVTTTKGKYIVLGHASADFDEPVVLLTSGWIRLEISGGMHRLKR